MTDDELDLEHAENQVDLLELARAHGEPSLHSKLVLGFSGLLTIGGIAAAIPTGGLSIVMAAAGLALLANEVQNMVSDIRIAPEVRARVKALMDRNRALWDEARRRRP
jgi:predicted phage tail protein